MKRERQRETVVIFSHHKAWAPKKRENEREREREGEREEEREREIKSVVDGKAVFFVDKFC